MVFMITGLLTWVIEDRRLARMFRVDRSKRSKAVPSCWKGTLQLDLVYVYQL